LENLNTSYVVVEQDKPHQEVMHEVIPPKTDKKVTKKTTAKLINSFSD